MLAFDTVDGWSVALQWQRLATTVEPKSVAAYLTKQVDMSDACT
jgi:hypothetical protein